MTLSKKAMNRKASRKPAKPEAVNVPIVQFREPKSVRVEKAENGVTVRSWGPKGERVMVAKTMQEALKHAEKLLG